MADEQSSNVQGMQDKGAGSAVKDKAKQGAAKGAKKAAKSLKNGGKLAKFLLNPYVLYALFIILCILMIIGFISFFLSMPGMLFGKLFDFLNDWWNGVERSFYRSSGKYRK